MSSERKTNKKGKTWPPVGPDEAEPIPVEIKKKPAAKTKKKKAVDPEPKWRSKSSRETEKASREIVITKNHISKAGWIAAAFSWAFFVTFWLLGVMR